MGLTIFVDFDDTCVETHPLYSDATNRFRRTLEGLGFDGQTAIDRLDARHIERMSSEASIAFRAHAWSETMVQIYHGFCLEAGTDTNPAIDTELRAIGCAPMMKMQAQPIEGMEEALYELRQAGHQLVLYTQADPHHQPRRIREAGISELFHTMFIVPRKTTPQLRDVLRTLRVEASACAYWGDSWKSDIMPALEVGIPLLLHYQPASQWHYDHAATEDPRRAQVHTIHNPREAIAVLLRNETHS